MKRNLVIASLFIFIIAVVIASCKESGCSRSLESAYNSHESQKMTGDCMGCHSPNGGADAGCFRIAGTAYDSIRSDSSVQNSVIKLYTQPNGTGELVIMLQVDKSGNFYTTTPVSFSNGLYPAIYSGRGNVRYMPQAAVTGDCNSCHGVLNSKLWAD